MDGLNASIILIVPSSTVARTTFMDLGIEADHNDAMSVSNSSPLPHLEEARQSEVSHLYFASLRALTHDQHIGRLHSTDMSHFKRNRRSDDWGIGEVTTGE
jgi:hypothetical protein